MKQDEHIEINNFRLWACLILPALALMIFAFHFMRIGGVEYYINHIIVNEKFAYSQLLFIFGIFLWFFLFSLPAYHALKMPDVYLRDRMYLLCKIEEQEFLSKRIKMTKDFPGYKECIFEFDGFDIHLNFNFICKNDQKSQIVAMSNKNGN